MTDNPYAAPEANSLVEPLSAAAAGIRAVSRAFRFVGLIGVVLFGFTTSSMTLALGWLFLREFPTPDGVLTDVLLNTFGNGILLIGSWITVRVGRNLLTARKGAFIAAMVLSCLMLISCVLTPLGIYCLVKLLKHWRAYCEEQQQLSANK